RPERGVSAATGKASMAAARASKVRRITDLRFLASGLLLNQLWINQSALVPDHNSSGGVCRLCGLCETSAIQPCGEIAAIEAVACACGVDHICGGLGCNGHALRGCSDEGGLAAVLDHDFLDAKLKI